MTTPIATQQLIQRAWLSVLPVMQVLTAMLYRDAAPGRLYVASALLFVAAAAAQSLLQSIHQRHSTALGEESWRALATATVAGACLVQGTVAALFGSLAGDEQRLLLVVALSVFAVILSSYSPRLQFWVVAPALLLPTALAIALRFGAQHLLPPAWLGTLGGLLAVFAATAWLIGRRPAAPAVEQPSAAKSEKSPFLVELSHGLRTPMAGISGAIELLERETLTAHQRHLVRTVQLSAEELLGVVSSVLDGNARERVATASAVPIPLGSSGDEIRIDALDTVLVVDDSDLNLDVLCQQLRTLGMESDTATDGLQGLAKWRKHRYALVIADIQMPRMDGLEMTRQIRAEERRAGRGRRTPIIALSANAQRGGDEEALAAGFDGYLTKPLMLRRLQEALYQWADTGAPETGPSPPTATDAGTAAPIDRQALMDMVGGNLDVVESVLQRFSDGGAELVKQISEAPGDSDRLRRLAHKLKGTARAVCAQRLGDLAERLEDSLSPVDVVALKAEWGRVAQALEGWRASVSA